MVVALLNWISTTCGLGMIRHNRLCTVLMCRFVSVVDEGTCSYVALVSRLAKAIDVCRLRIALDGLVLPRRLMAR
jgi:hypothetical protein